MPQPMIFTPLRRGPACILGRLWLAGRRHGCRPPASTSAPAAPCFFIVVPARPHLPLGSFAGVVPDTETRDARCLGMRVMARTAP